MPHTFEPSQKTHVFKFNELFIPVENAMTGMTPLQSKGNRPLQTTFKDHLKALVFFHLEEQHSAQQLLQTLELDDFARMEIAPENGIKKSSFSEATNERGLEQFMHVFQNLKQQAVGILPNHCPEPGDLVGIDGSLVSATLSMEWADYRKGSKKAKAHVGFDLNRGIPGKIYLTDGKGAEQPLVSHIISPGQTGVMDRGYQCHRSFDGWQSDGRFFICRIKAGTRKTIIAEHSVTPGGIIFYDAMVMLGTTCANQTRIPVRVVACKVNGIKYWIAINRLDLSPEQVAAAYKLRWDIEIFFAWWKRHLKVYHLIARSEYGLMVQLLAGLTLICCLRYTVISNSGRRSPSKESGSCESKSKMNFASSASILSQQYKTSKNRMPAGFHMQYPNRKLLKILKKKSRNMFIFWGMHE